MNAAPTTPAATIRWPIVAAGAFVLASVAAVGAFRWSGVAPTVVADAPVSISRELRFLDRRDGGVDVVDAASGRTVETLVGEKGFVRGTLRGLARERRREGIGPERPFVLAAHTDGRLTLVDPATARRVDLESFGPSNSGAFARLLREAADPSSATPRS